MTTQTPSPAIFLGSSSEGLDVAREIEVQLDEQAEVTLWQHDVFEPGRSGLESLSEALSQFDFAVLLLTPDDLTNTRGRSHKLPRDNVVFELGLFMGRLGRDRTFIVAERDADLRLPSDLDGITRITYRRRDNLAAAVSPACTRIAKRVRKLGRIGRVLPESTREFSFSLATYPRSQHPAFFSEVEELVPRAKTIQLIATGLNLIWQEHLVDILIERAASGEADVTICLANPYSPHVLDRLVEEEMSGKRAIVGRHGIKRNIDALLQKLSTAGNSAALKVVLFEQYPTFATLIFDDDIFVYPYGYQVLGTTSPIFHFRNDGSDEARFFTENARRILRDAIPAVDLVFSRSDRRYYCNHWVGAAIFAIPDADDSFYRFGSSIIEYDVQAEAQDAELNDDLAYLRLFIGEAREYGFHATLADALYFASDVQLDRIRAELEFLAEDFPSFELSNLHVADTLPTEHSVVVLCDDRTGVAEAIHHELLSRMYGLAISSKYLTGRTRKDFRNPNPERDSMMLHRYGAANIMNRFMPHFTLLSAPPEDPDERRSLIVQLQQRLDACVPFRRVEVNELCLMIQREGDPRWKILHRCPLSSR